MLLTDDQINNLLYQLSSNKVEYKLSVRQEGKSVHATITRRTEIGEFDEPAIYKYWKQSRERREGEQEVTLKTINEVFMGLLLDQFHKIK